MCRKTPWPVFLVLLLALSAGAPAAEPRKDGGAGAVRESTLLSAFDSLAFRERERRLRGAEEKARAAVAKANAAYIKARGEESARDLARTDRNAAYHALDQASGRLARLRFIIEALKILRKGFGALLDREAGALLREEIGFHREPALEKRLVRIVERLKRHSILPNDTLRVRILNSDGVAITAAAPAATAAATAGAIYFVKGHLAEEPSGDELMFTAARAISHSDLGHPALAIASRLGLTFAEVRFPTKAGVREPKLRAALREVAREVARGRYAPARMREADLMGARMALAAGASPRGIRETFARARSRGFYPDAAERLRALEKALGLRLGEEKSP
ncbi:MAG: hypothetical protein V3V62_12855 [bacterium]